MTHDEIYAKIYQTHTNSNIYVYVRRENFINNRTIHFHSLKKIQEERKKNKRVNRYTRVCEANSFRSDALLHACLSIELSEKGKTRSEESVTR